MFQHMNFGREGHIQIKVPGFLGYLSLVWWNRRGIRWMQPSRVTWLVQSCSASVCESRCQKRLWASLWGLPVSSLSSEFGPDHVGFSWLWPWVIFKPFIFYPLLCLRGSPSHPETSVTDCGSSGTNTSSSLFLSPVCLQTLPLTFSLEVTILFHDLVLLLLPCQVWTPHRPASRTLEEWICFCSTEEVQGLVYCFPSDPVLNCCPWCPLGFAS